MQNWITGGTVECWEGRPAQPVRGGQWRDHRQVINAICWVKRTGSPWRDLPERYGPWKPAHQRFTRWAADGTWARLKAQVIALAELDADIDWTLRSTPPSCAPTSTPPEPLKGADRRRNAGTGKYRPVPPRTDHQDHTLADGRGRSLATLITPGQAADTRQMIPLLEHLRVARPSGTGRPRTRPTSVTGDKAYSSRANRQACAVSGSARRSRNPTTRSPTENAPVHAVAGHRRSTRPATAAATRSNAGFNQRKHWRGLATSFDKPDMNFQATLDLVEMLDWLRAVPDGHDLRDRC
ncbi:IS5 family transposase [Jidongwangia harbinensis]|uniref:IS5 family transposase n=1 Tax=Jidongwangia harbinensis TaxID=2878561 RepID=UPI001CD949C6|nr:IS5 family transposase [Jidongwangia harbinensis]MCA2211945.1 IS5 family transposase [Jidongwangia harbinensis]